MKPVRLFSLTFENVTLAQATDQIIALARSDAKGKLVVTPNVDHIVTMRKDSHMREVFESAALRYADGMPLVWLSRLERGQGLIERVTGADLLDSVARAAALKEVSIFLMGGLPGVAERAAERLVAASPQLRIAGTFCPPFGFEHDEDQCHAIADMIRTSGADILFAGVGTPKQEKWLARWIDECGVRVGVGVGAAFDFLAGTAKRAPRIIQRTGLEWLWRLAHEPRRLFGRYVLRDSRFLLMAIDHLRKAYRQHRRDL